MLLSLPPDDDFLVVIILANTKRKLNPLKAGIPTQVWMPRTDRTAGLLGRVPQPGAAHGRKAREKQADLLND